MLLTILLAALQITAVSAAPAPEIVLRPYVPEPAGASKNCPRATVRQAKENAPLRPRRFNELPSGRLELAVLRQVGGCPIPAVIREGIGGPPVARE